MDPRIALVVIVGLVAVSSAIGALWRARRGTVHAVSGSTDAAAIRALGVGEDATTLLQFSTAFCTYCPATRRLLGQLSRDGDGIAFVEYDLTDDIETARRFGVMQTPTVLVIDRGTRIVGRIGGPPRAGELRELLASRGHAFTHTDHEQKGSHHAAG